MYTFQPGDILEHFKGNLYEFIAFASHSETMEELVVYKALYGEGGIWVRPKAMFLSTTTVAGKEVPRFQLYKPVTP